jgi:hypothetical protein
MIQQLLPNEWSTNFKRAYEFACCDDAFSSRNSIAPFGMLLLKIRMRRRVSCFNENEHSLKKKFVYVSDKIYTIAYVNRSRCSCASRRINLKGSAINTYI